MKASTKVSARAQSIGYPESLAEWHDIPVSEVIKQLLAWMLKYPMGSRMDIRLARNPAELETAKTTKTSQVDEALGFIEEMLASSEDETKLSTCLADI